MDLIAAAVRGRSVCGGVDLRTLKRNRRTFHYCLYSNKIPIYDEYGNETTEYIVQYEDPVEMQANISPANGYAQTEQFGNNADYDKVITTCWMDCPIDENTVLFIDKEPEFTNVDTNRVEESQTLYGDDTVTPETVSVPLYDYVVRRVARSLNSISIAVSKVNLS